MLDKEYYGFIKFLSSAIDKLVVWTEARSTNFQSKRIVSVALQEWDCMSDFERAIFIKSQKNKIKQQVRTWTPLIGTHSFISFMFHQSLMSTGLINKLGPKFFELYSKQWHDLTLEEKEQYKGFKPSQMLVDFTIEKRSELHKIYDPKKLMILELLLKTRPKKSLGATSLFLNDKAVSFHNYREEWSKLSENEKNVYKNAVLLDKRRYRYEKELWFTKLLQLDFDREDLRLEDFSIEDFKTNSTLINSVINFGGVAIKTRQSTLNSFSLFFQDSKLSLKEASIAWKNMSKTDKAVYIEKYRKIKEMQKEDLKTSNNKTHIFFDIFRHNKSKAFTRRSHLYRTVPSILKVFDPDRKYSFEERNIKWKELNDSKKQVYYHKLECIKKEIQLEWISLNKKAQLIEGLIKESDELWKVKVKLGLMRSRKLKNYS